jgi:RNA polymerase sigma factor (sigma-70 family)
VPAAKSPRLTRAQQTLCATNQPLAYSTALKLWYARPSVRAAGTLDDANQAALVGLARASRGFDPSRGWQFSTYAVTCARRAVERAAASGVLDRRRHTVTPLTAAPETALTVEDPPPDDSAELRAKLYAALAALPTPDRTVLVLRFGLDGGEPTGYVKLGERLGVSAERARRQVEGALLKLQRRLGGWGCRDDYR